MGSFDKKIAKFLDIMIDNGGYNKVLEGLKNTLLIALVGLAVGIIIGTLIATVRVVPKYKRLPRVLNGIASFYVGFFRGTPMVVQLLLFYYVLLPHLGVKSSTMRKQTMKVSAMAICQIQHRCDTKAPPDRVVNIICHERIPSM